VKPPKRRRGGGVIEGSGFLETTGQRGGGFTRFRRATETPFNMILEARP
jgi:hypothetical protein